MDNRNTFLLTLRHEIIENRRMLFLTVLAIWGLGILLGAFYGYHFPSETGAEVWTYAMASLASACIVASTAFSKMKTKEGRINDLMLPASMFSKFAVRWIAVVPVLFLVLLAGFFICDFARILTAMISLGPDTVANSPSLTNVTNPFVAMRPIALEPAERFAITSGFLLAYFFFQSLYLLGAILWPKLSFIKTMVAIALVQTLLSLLLSSCVRFIFPFFWDSSISGLTLLWMMNGVTFLLSVSAYILAYVRYTRTQIIYKLF